MKKKIKLITKFLFALLFIAAGINHFRASDFYVSIMPPYLPWHLELVYISGVIEIGLGVMLCFQKWQRLAGWGLVALLIAVFPANIHMALHPELYPKVSSTLLYLRLPIQFLLILWAYWYTKEDSEEKLST